MDRSRSGPLIVIEDDKTTIYKRKIDMTPDNVIDIVNGLVMSEETKNNHGPWKVTLPTGTDMHSVNDKGEPIAKRIQDISPQIKEVVVGNGRGVSIEKV